MVADENSRRAKVGVNVGMFCHPQCQRGSFGVIKFFYFEIELFTELSMEKAEVEEGSVKFFVLLFKGS